MGAAGFEQKACFWVAIESALLRIAVGTEGAPWYSLTRIPLLEAHAGFP
jgi:hypothetical protein